MKKVSTRRKLTYLLVLTLLSVCAITAYAVTSVRLAQGTIPSSILFNGPAELTMTHITMQPGETIPWHYHPGAAYVILNSGSVTEDDGCGGSEIFNTSQAFEEPIPRVHQVRNTGSVPAELFVTFIVPSGQPRTVNTGGPLCGPPTSIDQCKNQGWQDFNFPDSFKNQGDCVSSIQSHR